VALYLQIEILSGDIHPVSLQIVPANGLIKSILIRKIGGAGLRPQTNKEGVKVIS